jgi:hypothetical protein
MNPTAQTVWAFRFKLLDEGCVQVAACRMWSLSQNMMDPPLVLTLVGVDVSKSDKTEVKIANSLARFYARNIPALRSAYMIVLHGDAKKIGPALYDVLDRTIPHYETENRPTILGYEMITPAAYRPDLLLTSRCGLSYGLSAYANGKPQSPEEFIAEFQVAFPYNQPRPRFIEKLTEALT